MSIVIKDLAVADGRLSFGVEGGPSDRLWYEVEPEYNHGSPPTATTPPCSRSFPMP